MSHRCPMCDNPYPYMCAECSMVDVGPAASRQQTTTLSMGKEFLNGSKTFSGRLQELRNKMGLSTPAMELAPKVIVPKKSIASGEDVCF